MSTGSTATGTGTGDWVIRTEDLTRHFPHVEAVDGLTLSVMRGSVFGFLGPNGSGKTTTIRMLLGLLAPTRGRAEVLGFDCRTQAEDIRARCGALLEHPGLYERLTAYDNLDFHARVWHLPRQHRRVRVEELLQQMGLWDRRHEIAGTWSRGMKQKLGVARALLHRPQLVFLDEPTSGLDAVAAASLREDLGRLVREDRLTVFLTTHNLVEAESFCHHVAVIRQGKLLAQGAPHELRQRDSTRVTVSGKRFSPDLIAQLQNHPLIRRVQPENLSENADANANADENAIVTLNLELAPGTAMADITRLIVHAGADVEEIQRGRHNLEDTFLTLVRETPVPSARDRSS